MILGKGVVRIRSGSRVFRISETPVAQHLKHGSMAVISNFLDILSAE
jgi:hypothetical protein